MLLKYILFELHFTYKTYWNSRIYRITVLLNNFIKNILKIYLPYVFFFLILTFYTITKYNRNKII